MFASRGSDFLPIAIIVIGGIILFAVVDGRFTAKSDTPTTEQLEEDRRRHEEQRAEYDRRREERKAQTDEYRRQRKAKQQQKYQQKTYAPSSTKCPSCQSIGTAYKIPTGERVGSAIVGGLLFSRKARATFHCRTCGYNW